MNMKMTALATACVMLTACASNGIDQNYQMYLETQKSIAVNKPQQPLVRIKALNGQSITMNGVEEFVVYAPENTNSTTHVGQYVPPRNDTVEVAKAALGVFGSIGGVVAGGWAAREGIRAVGNAATAGYAHVQAPQPNVTISGQGVVGAGSYSNSTASAGSVIGSGTASTIGGNGTIGSGSYGNVGGNGTIGSGTYGYVGQNGTTGTGNYGTIGQNGTTGTGDFTNTTTTTTTTNDNHSNVTSTSTVE